MKKAMVGESAATEEQVTCFHCGQSCEEILEVDAKMFCCFGCKTVYEILRDSNLCEYYTLEKNPGLTRRNTGTESFDFLDDAIIRKKVLVFESERFCKVTFHTPAIHCVSCIWLLENLKRLGQGILRSEVNFARKSVTIDFDPNDVKLSRIACLLGSVGYAPRISLDADTTTAPAPDRSLVIKLAVAGFCFGNVMLFSFPEYLGLDHSDAYLMRVFSWLNLVLSVPVFFYSASGYFRSAANSFKQKQINIDVPIAAGLLALFLRSSHDIITATGPGYLDSFNGLVFFLLIGRWFQGKTYESLAFDRDFKSYFPLAVRKRIGDQWQPGVIYELRRGDQVTIRNMEIIPADATLLDEVAYVDYSFVTGESRPAKVLRGQSVFAGGRLVGKPVLLVIEKKTSQSHLTSLWNSDAFKKITESGYQKTIDRAARWFTWVVMGVALVTGVYWQMTDPKEMWLVVTAVLMVACPCALALAAPFTYGSMLRVFGENQLYLKNADVIERMAAIDAIVFDKTGTVTHGDSPDVTFCGAISPEQLAAVKLLAGASTHPLSAIVYRSIAGKSADKLSYFKEIPSKGVQAMVAGRFVQAGSAGFVGFTGEAPERGSKVFVAVDDVALGYFIITTSIRKDIKNMLDRLGRKCAALLSGDNEADKATMSGIFPPAAQLLFNQDPHDKLAFISSLQRSGKKVLMVGDGLNDAGALKQSDVGIAVTDDTGIFTPACDGILRGEQIGMLDKLLGLAGSANAILKAGFVISFLYNGVALTFAVTGRLTPVVAAVLMPISSISVVAFCSIAVNWAARKELK